MTRWLFGLLLAVAAFWPHSRNAVAAHVTVVSSFTFHKDVQPILLARCAGCHRPGGSGPGSLLTFEDARALSWPMRQALLRRSMPPVWADSGAAVVQEAPSLTARELDVLMTWASGGMPEGTPVAAPTPREQAPAPAITAAQGRGLRSVEIGASTPLPDRLLTAVAIRPLTAPLETPVRVDVVAPSGRRTTLMTFQHRAEWPTRYVFAQAVVIERGSRLELRAAPWPAEQWRSLLGAASGVSPVANSVTALLDVLE